MKTYRLGRRRPQTARSVWKLCDPGRWHPLFSLPAHGTAHGGGGLCRRPRAKAVGGAVMARGRGATTLVTERGNGDYPGP